MFDGEFKVWKHYRQVVLNLSPGEVVPMRIDDIEGEELNPQQLQEIFKKLEDLSLAANPEKANEQHQLSVVIGKMLKTLAPREERIICKLFGLDGDGGYTMEEVGQDFGVTRECIRQILAKVLRKLRQPSCSRVLRDFVPIGLRNAA